MLYRNPVEVHYIAKSIDLCVNQNIKVFRNFQVENFPLFASVKSLENLVPYWLWNRYYQF